MEWETNDPAAEVIRYQWDCSPRPLCVVQEASGRNVVFNCIWDEVENTDFIMALRATALQNGREVDGLSLWRFHLNEDTSYDW